MTTETQQDKELNEMLDFWAGSLTDVKEVKQVIPPTQNVKLVIADIDIFAEDKDGIARNWKFFSIKFRIEDGIEVAGERKYKGPTITQMVPYYANPKHYDYKKPFFSKGQFLLPISQLCKAVALENPPQMVLGGLEDTTASGLAELLKGKSVLGNIVQKKEESYNPDSNKYEPTGSMINEVKNFRKLPDSNLV